jgi:hypothetical protein
MVKEVLKDRFSKEEVEELFYGELCKYKVSGDPCNTYLASGKCNS